MAKAQKQNAPEAMQTLRGTVARRIFYNHDNGYCVLSVESESCEEIKATGNMPSVREGDEYEFVGQWVDTPKYGKQFRFQASMLILPSGTAGTARYLSNVTYGVGAKKAERIVAELGENAIEQIQADPAALDKLSFLTDRQKTEIAEDLSKNSVQAELAAMICKPGTGIGMGTVAKIMNKYGPDAVRVIKENPYILSQELWGVGFIKADIVARQAGIKPSSEFRVEAAVDYILREAGTEGHVYLRPRDIMAKTIGRKGIIEASGVTVGALAKASQKLIDDGRSVRECDCVYSKKLWLAECGVAASIRLLLTREPKVIEGFDEQVADVESRDGIEYAPQQRDAVKMALKNHFSVICGGPGTGKSTIAKAIADIYKRLNPYNHIYLAAPTGRAAKRLGETTGRAGMTIHRLLRYQPAHGGCEYGEGNPLPGPGILLVDEVSMVDVELAASLFAAVDNLQVVFIGDPQQLPSVGPGSVLRDLIGCEAVSTVQLEFNYRQANGSVISERASSICKGIMPEIQSDGDWMFIPVDSAAMAAETALQTFNALQAERGILDWLCLAPMYKGDAGITKLNNDIREIINPKQEGQAELCGFRVGDKILCTRNIYLLGTFNGDMGLVVEVDKGNVFADFGDGAVKIPYEFLDCFKPGYAISIHKAQGSEVPVVVMVLTKQNFIMLTREIFYTGVTRAKSQLILIADEKAVKMAVKNGKMQKRFSMLQQRIRGEV